LMGSLGVQLFGFVSRYPWQVFAGVLVVTFVIVELLRNGSQTAGADIETGFGCDGGGDGGGD
jgi:hypothetical protein